MTKTGITTAGMGIRITWDSNRILRCAIRASSWSVVSGQQLSPVIEGKNDEECDSDGGKQSQSDEAIDEGEAHPIGGFVVDGFLLSHPFAQKRAQGWGTRFLWLVCSRVTHI